MYILAFSPAFIILSISVEGYFYLCYSANLVLWIPIEKAYRAVHASKPKQAKYQFQTDDARIVLFFLFFIQVGFFGTGK